MEGARAELRTWKWQGNSRIIDALSGSKDPLKEGVMVWIKSKEGGRELSSVLGSSVVSMKNQGILDLRIFRNDFKAYDGKR